MNGPPWVAVWTDGGIKRLVNVPRSVILLGLGRLTVLSALDNETAHRVIRVFLADLTDDPIMDIFVGGPDSYQVWHGDGRGRFSAPGHSMYP